MPTPYRNPIVPGFNPDPSCICVDGTFYLVTSSFLYFPGLPVYTSRDLVNWTQVGNVVSRQEQLDLTGCKIREGTVYPGGLWAPTIRYHEAVFYVVVTNVYNDRAFDDFSRWQNLLYTCTDPIRGDWSNPVSFDFPGYDTSPFFDDGKVYIQGSFYWRVRPEISQFEIDVKTGTSLSGPPKKIWSGEGGDAPEAPHMYKKDGWYYLILAEGRTELGHCSTMARSRTVWGPWEPCPHNPIVRASSPDAYFQGLGHADLFQTPTGQWFAVCLATRDAKVNYPLGRETCLIPYEWPTGGWPKALAPLESNMQAELPAITQSLQNTIHTDVIQLFKKQAWPAEILTLRNRAAGHYSMTPDGLSIRSSKISLPDPDRSPILVARRQRALRSTIKVTLTFPTGVEIFETGLAVYLDHAHHFDFAATRSLIGTGEVRVRTVGAEPVITERFPVDLPVRLKVEAYEDRYEFYGCHKDEWVLISQTDAKDVSGGFTGVVIGVYALGLIEDVTVVVRDWTVDEEYPSVST